MQSSFQRRLWILLIAGSAAFGCWKWVPGTTLDKVVFTGVCTAHYNPPLFVKGAGSHDRPWTLRTFATVPKIDLTKVPGVVALEDDPSGFFQTHPHSPLDVAVILTNLRRLGARDAATACVLAWDSPDPMGLTALDRAIKDFRSLVMSAPLSRAAVPEPLPLAFRNTSVPLSQVNGDVSLLPIVNRIPLPGIILGGENCTAGFQSLDSERGNPCANLLAVWDKRVVFSFPLALALRDLGISLDKIEIRPGEFIRLGADGPVIPIDRYGQITMEPTPVPAARVIPAEDLIDVPADTLAETLRNRMILRDDRSAADPGTRAFSAALVGSVTYISSDAGRGVPRVFHRPALRAEWMMLAVLLVILALVSKLSTFPRNILFLVVGGVCVAAQYVALGAGSWLPGIPAVAALASAWIVAMIVPLKTIDPLSRVKPEKPAKPEKLPKPPKPAKAEKPAKSAKPAKPEKPAKPTKPAKPEKPAKPAKPVKAEKPAKPAKPAKAEKPAKPAKPDSSPEIAPPAKSPAPRKAAKRAKKKTR